MAQTPSTVELEPQLVEHGPPDAAVALLVWRFPRPRMAVSSGPLGGGLGPRQWVINAQVPHSYARLDPDAHLMELAAGLGLEGPGVGMLTAVDVGAARRVEDGGAVVHVSVGVTLPTWAAAPGDALDGDGPAPGTVNVVGIVPERLSDAALVNAVMSVTEAKAQALWDVGIRATGTASDAVCLVCPDGGRAQAFGGPRSRWGSRLARAVHRAVVDGCRAGGSS